MQTQPSRARRKKNPVKNEINLSLGLKVKRLRRIHRTIERKGGDNEINVIKEKECSPTIAPRTFPQPSSSAELSVREFEAKEQELIK
jgi:hypothetical protein